MVAWRADHEGFASHPDHQGRPRRLWSSQLVQVGELSDLVDFYRAALLAQFTLAGSEPGDQLFAAGDRDWLAVGEDRCALSFERDAAEAGDQWFPASIPFDRDLEACARPVRCLWTVALYLRAIFVTVERCLPARVLSIEVS